MLFAVAGVVLIVNGAIAAGIVASLAAAFVLWLLYFRGSSGEVSDDDSTLPPGRTN